MNRILVPILVFFIGMGIVFSFSGCGGGGSDAQSSTSPTPPPASSPKVLSWTPPTAYSDGTPLDPARDLNIFEIYVNNTGTFSNNDAPMAYVSAVDPTNGLISTNFNLSNLSPFLSPGVPYRAALRSVAIDGSKSPFSASAAFSL